MSELPTIITDDHIKRGRRGAAWPEEWFDGQTRLIPHEHIKGMGYISDGSFITTWHRHCTNRGMQGHTTTYREGVAIRSEQ